MHDQRLFCLFFFVIILNISLEIGYCRIQSSIFGSFTNYSQRCAGTCSGEMSMRFVHICLKMNIKLRVYSHTPTYTHPSSHPAYSYSHSHSYADAKAFVPHANYDLKCLCFRLDSLCIRYDSFVAFIEVQV